MRVMYGLAGALLATSAIAADIGQNRQNMATQGPGMLAPQWQGLYVGGSIGWAADPSAVVPGATPSGFSNVLNTTSAGAPTGFTAGGRIGYDWQSGMGVFGIESDLSWSGIERDGNLSLNANAILNGLGSTATQWQERINWWGSTNVRLGMPVLGNQALAYVLGGVAYGDPTTNVTFSVTLPWAQGTTNGSFGGTTMGWDAGAGLAVKFSPNSELFIEGRWVAFGDISNQLNLSLPSGRNQITTYNTSASQSWGFGVGQVGYSYHF